MNNCTWTWTACEHICGRKGAEGVFGQLSTVLISQDVRRKSEEVMAGLPNRICDLRRINLEERRGRQSHPFGHSLKDGNDVTIIDSAARMQTGFKEMPIRSAPHGGAHDHYISQSKHTR